MLRYAFARILGAIPTLLLVIAIAFLMVHAAPGGPFDSERVLPPDIKENIERAYHLDETLPQQFYRYIKGVVRGDLGPSYRYRDFSVSELIAGAIPVTMRIGALAILLALIVGISAGLIAALRRNTVLDRLVTGIAMIGISVPVFVFAPLMVLVFAVTLKWLPASYTGSDGADRLLLPVIALAMPQIAFIARLTRASLIDVMNSDYVRTAKAQGLKTLSIVRYHAFRPAMLPLISYLGPAFAAVLTGSVVVEHVFGVPGVGRFLITASANRDYTLVLGITVFYAAMVVFLNLVVDLLYAFVDPRVRTR
ncbi:MAG: ABC transporter permease subunit [Proteobacteria bacterium]|nr:ABC transporter permease subunit [Pseudomonadota bacterium]MDA0992318.1 ABC transporter permease subunit [Pseudomonadota bacterium]